MFYRQNFLFVGIDLKDDKISECYDQLSNSTLKKFVFVCLSLLKKLFVCAYMEMNQLYQTLAIFIT